MDINAIWGPLAAVGFVILIWWKYIRPRLEEAEKWKDDRITKLEEKNAKLTDLYIQTLRDVGEGFDMMAQDFRNTLESWISEHEQSATARTELLLTRLEEHKDEILKRLDGQARQARRSAEGHSDVS